VAARPILETGQVALQHSHWTLSGTTPDGQPVELSGRSTDVFRREPDGGWLLAIGHSKGVDILT
jgi:ketosteroid isomerase-like protein